MKAALSTLNQEKALVRARALFADVRFQLYFKVGSVGSLTMAMSDTTFWFTSLLTTVVLLLPVVAWRFYKIDVHPTLTDKVTAQYHNLK